MDRSTASETCAEGTHAASAGLRLLYRKNGLHTAPHHGFVCTAHTDEDVTQLIEIHKAAMEELRAQWRVVKQSRLVVRGKCVLLIKNGEIEHEQKTGSYQIIDFPAERRAMPAYPRP